ncbi:hypothetical protein A8709_04815 [Paenibacillus pectinilyticus]|uniref:Uncharacterized protein n=1 Tax=Paenibacillus pectinilyticus TaxID=512399 RepID=A0A1C0ZSJ0_9BACL|nr:hypothetical protein [Paenibacillus pectinilyticus]OCT11027.1 hypothetical protein A8709_04815 [Paenibacillus pectinilyticus]
MVKFLKFHFIILLASAIIFPAYSYASASTSQSDNALQSKSQSIHQFFSYFFNDHKKVNEEFNDFIASWNQQDFDDINWDDDGTRSSLDIWKKWFSY